ncbi:uncharacterized protein LOC126982435 [Eriocheir sinensis]|uniref:uncharacterized protein LOC126982435 n=1 Tax=Eriocheir sinensis TaxID=95602 RepID=UPI0021CADE99|nr:uncharacterized protein LOC126982435 [Eriocheir sinensis]
MMVGKNVAVALAVVSWVGCLVVALSHPEGVARRKSLDSVDLAHPIDNPLALDRPAADGDHKKYSTAIDINKFPKETMMRESDFEREKRREMEVAREREQINMTREAIHSVQTSELDREREDDRQREILREIMKAEERKREILQRKPTVPLHARKVDRLISVHDQTNTNRSEHISLQRQIDRSLRGGDAVEVKGNPQRSTLHDDGDGGWSQSYLNVDQLHHDQSRRKAPILILEQVPVRYPDSVESVYFSETHSEESRGGGYSNKEGRPASDRRFVDSTRETTLVDPRAPDRPVILPRPSTAIVDRRPDRLNYPYKYDEINLAVFNDPAKHHKDPLDNLPIDQSFFPIGEPGPTRSLVPHAPYGLPHSVEGLDAAAHADATNLHLALEQALVAEHTLHAQAIQAGKIKEAAVAAHLVNQAAAHRLATQQLAAQNVAAQQLVAQKAAVQQLAVQKAAAQQLAAQKAEVQRIAAGTAASKLKAAQLGHIAAGNEAIKTAIKTSLESEITHRLKKLIPQDSLARVLSGAGVEVQVGGASVAAPFTPNLQHHLIPRGQQIQQMRQELLHRLSLLKPYFERSTSGYVVPSVIPDLPRGEHFTPLQVEALPKVVLQIPNEVVHPISLHVDDLEEKLRPPLNVEFLEYLLGLPDDLFLVVTNLSKLQFLAMLFPRLYRSSVQLLTPFNNTSVLADTPVYTLSTTTPSSPYVTTEIHPHHKSQYTHPSYETPPVNSAYHTTLRPTSTGYSFTSSPLYPVTTTSSVHKINIAPHPPSLSSLGYGNPKPSSVIELSDLPNNYGDKEHHHPKHHLVKNQQEYTHGHDSEENSNGSHKHVHHHHVHHHLHSVASTSASPSSITVKEPIHTSFQSGEGSDHQTVHKHFHLLLPEAHQDKGKTVPRSDGALLASTTPRIAASSPVSGVGLRPHGSNLLFSTPASTTRHVLLSSPFTPLLPNTTPTTALTSSYSSYLPTFSDTSHHSASSTTNSRSFLDDSPSLTYVSPQSLKPTTTISSSTTVQHFVLTTTAKPVVPFTSTHPFPSSSGPFTPATSPIFTVTQIPSTPDSSTVLRLGPNVTLNGQFLPSLTKLLLHDSGRKESEESNSNAYEPLVEKLSLASEEGSGFDRVPGTDSNDDDHILSPFSKRKGNTTHTTQQTKNDSSVEFPEEVKRVTVSQTTSSSDGWRPIIKPPHQKPQINVSAPPPASVVLPQRDLHTQKNHPVPQLVGADGLPLAQPLLELHQADLVIPAGKTLSATLKPLPLTADDIAELPSYLREAPPCASVLTEKSFCLLPHGYPSELASFLVKKYSEELAEIWKVLPQHTHRPPPPPDSEGLLRTGVDTSVQCEVEEKTVELSWSRDVLKIFPILHNVFNFLYVQIHDEK